MNRTAYILIVIITAIVSVAANAQPTDDILKLATTTSTENSGLLDAILPQFEKLTGYRVNVIAVGTGRALKYGETGEVDCVLVHSKAAEESFVERGFGINRKKVMYNDFVIVGPDSDPAGVALADNAPDAMARIEALGEKTASSGRRSVVQYVSRGDDSGTHNKEMSLWDDGMVFPRRGWYLEAGQGMARVLVMASELDAYTLSDRGTFLALRERLESVVLFDSDPLLHNPYSVIAVNPAVHPHVNAAAASALIDWLVSPDGQELIDEFRLDGEQLFYPNASKTQ